jgi:predicted nucleotide-binding protein
VATKKRPEEPLPPPRLVKTRAQLEEELRARLSLGRELAERPIQSEGELEQAWKDRERWSSYNTELLRRSFDNRSIADDYDWSPGFGVLGLNQSLAERVDDFRDSQRLRINRLESILERLPLIPETPQLTAPSSLARSASPDQRASVFIVHGHDRTSLDAVARFVEKLGLEAVILHERPNQGRTLIEKFEANAVVAFAVVLLTADDTCQSTIGSELGKPRARQNVIFELGYFFGALGRHRVAALYAPGVELPSDVAGLAYIPLDASEAWKSLLAKELHAARLVVDLGKALE